MDPELFFPFQRERVSPDARAACAGCAVKKACLEHALRFEDMGFWAGTSAAERERLREAAGIPLERRNYQIWPRPACGTAAGYQRHRRAGEEACVDCKRAHTELIQERYPDRFHSVPTGKRHEAKSS